MVLGFEGRPYYARDFYASQVLSLILGGGMSSRLFQEVRETRGLCYAIYAFHWSFSDTGIFGVHAATGEEELAELAPVIAEELMRAADGISEEEVERARAQMRSSLLMSQESPASRAGQIARQILFNGTTISNTELMDRLTAITAERLSDLAGRTFVGRRRRSPRSARSTGCPSLDSLGAQFAGERRPSRAASGRARLTARPRRVRWASSTAGWLRPSADRGRRASLLRLPRAARLRGTGGACARRAAAS